MTGVLGRRGEEIQTRRHMKGECHVTSEAEIEVMHLQGKENTKVYQKPRTTTPLEPSERAWP